MLLSTPILRCPEKYGAFGENFTVRQTESAVCIGDVYEIGAVDSGIPATPALLETVSGAGASKTWHFKAQQSNRLVLRVLKEGYESNLSLILVERPFRSGLLPELTHHAPPAQ